MVSIRMQPGLRFGHRRAHRVQVADVDEPHRDARAARARSSAGRWWRRRARRPPRRICAGRPAPSTSAICSAAIPEAQASAPWPLSSDVTSSSSAAVGRVVVARVAVALLLPAEDAVELLHGVVEVARRRVDRRRDGNVAAGLSCGRPRGRPWFGSSTLFPLPAHAVLGVFQDDALVQQAARGSGRRARSSGPSWPRRARRSARRPPHRTGRRPARWAAARRRSESKRREEVERRGDVAGAELARSPWRCWRRARTRRRRPALRRCSGRRPGCRRTRCAAGVGARRQLLVRRLRR